MNTHDRKVRRKAYQILINCWKQKTNRVYAGINLVAHFPPFVPTVLQESFLDRFYERLEKELN